MRTTDNPAPTGSTDTRPPLTGLSRQLFTQGTYAMNRYPLGSPEWQATQERMSRFLDDLRYEPSPAERGPSELEIARMRRDTPCPACGGNGGRGEDPCDPCCGSGVRGGI